LKTILKYLIFLFCRISIFKSAGFINHWINTEYRKILNINVDDFDFSEIVKQEYDSLNLYQLQSTLYLLIFGNLLALFSVGYEFIKKWEVPKWTDRDRTDTELKQNRNRTETEPKQN
jgi:hypothetical protein